MVKYISLSQFFSSHPIEPKYRFCLLKSLSIPWYKKNLVQMERETELTGEYITRGSFELFQLLHTQKNIPVHVDRYDLYYTDIVDIGRFLLHLYNIQFMSLLKLIENCNHSAWTYTIPCYNSVLIYVGIHTTRATLCSQFSHFILY